MIAPTQANIVLEILSMAEITKSLYKEVFLRSREWEPPEETWRPGNGYKKS